MFDLAVSRRRFLASGVGLAAGALTPRLAAARPRDVEYAINQFFGDVELKEGRIMLDLPRHSDTGTTVPITVSVDSAMTEADHPVALHVLADGNPRPHIFSAWFSPAGGKAEISTRIRLEGAQTVTAVVEMSDGTHWRADQELTVSFGACADVGEGSISDVREFRPVTRVNAPDTAEPGEIVNIRAIISHPMETGLRQDGFNQWIPERIIYRFECLFNGVEIFRVRPYHAISTNPYFSFYAQVEESGTFTLNWHDTNGEVYTNSAEITVS